MCFINKKVIACKSFKGTYFLGGTCPTLTLTQMTLRVCIPMAQVALPALEEVLRVDALVSSTHCPHGPACQ